MTEIYPWFDEIWVRYWWDTGNIWYMYGWYMIDIVSLYHWHIRFSYCFSKGQGVQPSRKCLDFKFPPILDEEVGNQIYIFSKFNISKNYFCTFRFSMENLKDFLWNARNLPIFLSRMQHPQLKCNMQAHPHFPKCLSECVWGGGLTKVRNFYLQTERFGTVHSLSIHLIPEWKGEGKP